MRGAPGFVKWPDPVNGQWKIDLLRWLGKTCQIDTLIETGTCQGVTPWSLQNDFRQIFTVELHDGLYEESRQRLDGIPNVKLYHGSSRELLPKMIEEANTNKILFWLDAHSSGPHTADDGDPLPAEIGAIISNGTPACIHPMIVIDDMIGLDEFMGQVGLKTYGPAIYQAEYRTGEILMYDDLYYVPPFEDQNVKHVVRVR